MHMAKASNTSSKISIQNEELILLPEKAIYWKRKKTLILADVHMGKISHFRKNGIGLPLHAEEKNLSLLENLLLKTKAEKVYILGDLFHSSKNSQWPLFKEWMENWPQVRFLLIRGNHDILPDEDYYSSRLEISEPMMTEESFIFTHEPLNLQMEGLYNLCGHIHPAVRLEGKARQSMKLPCFYFSDQTGILPAFGAFTGHALITPMQKDKVFVIANQSVIRLEC